MATVTSLEHRRIRRTVLDILSCGRAMSLTEIALAAERHFDMAPTPFEIETALAELVGNGHPIQRHEGAAGDEYQLIPGWGGGSAA